MSDNDNVPAAASTATHAEASDPALKLASQPSCELTVIVRPCDLDIWELIGTRAQIEAEGVLPDSIRWPDPGARPTIWRSGRQEYTLSWRRVKLAKGVQPSILDADCWELRCATLGGEFPAHRRIRLLRQELEAAMYALTREGSAESELHRRRVDAAKWDEAFQAFKFGVPGLIPTPRERKPKSQRVTSEVNATRRRDVQG